MRFVKTFFVVLLALAWLPITAHCQLESIPGFEFLACQAGDTASENPDSHCADTGCCATEKSSCRSERSPQTRISPNFFLYSAARVPSALALADMLPAEVSRGILTAAPPELLKTWHFTSRTALPVRAPSLAS